jgi:hypothetical protein
VPRGLASAIFTSGSTMAMVIAPPLITFSQSSFWMARGFPGPQRGRLALGAPIAPDQWPLSPNRAAAEPSCHTLPAKALLRDPQTLGYALARFFGDRSC